MAWGAKTIPEGGFVALPQRFHAPGLLIAGDGAGLVNVPALKGIHYAVESGRLAAEAAWAACRGRRAVGLRRGAAGFVPLGRAARGAQHAAGVRLRVLAGSRARGRRDGDARAGSRRATGRRRPMPTRSCCPAARSYPAPDGVLTFDKLSSVFLSGNRTRDDQPSHIRVATPVPARARRDVVANVPGAGLRNRAGGRRPGHGDVTPSNCVQCGAITAKGGRLTPPEGGSGPEYTLT